MTVPRDVGNLVAAAIAGLVAGCSQTGSQQSRSAAPPSALPVPARAEPSASPSAPLVGRLVKVEHGALAVARLGDIQLGERGLVFVREAGEGGGWKLVGNGVVEAVDGAVTRIGLRDRDGDPTPGAVLDVAAGAEVKLERHPWTHDQPSARFICCKGRNDCKGRGNCKTEQNDCKGKNDCKGRGGCAAPECPSGP